MDTFDSIAEVIIREQELVIGPLAWSEAAKVQELTVDPRSKHATIQAQNKQLTIDKLVNQYERLFGQASHDVCREAASDLVHSLAESEVPKSLR